ncbi:MAG TPA: hypothetical protein VNU95_02180 [Candidatus Acidoferrales bacterium]|nr:hypothetical protein [Candidatus Acidoferrales bacterium]
MKTKPINSWRIDLNSISLETILNWGLKKRGANRMLMVLRMQGNRGRWYMDSHSAENWITRNLDQFLIDKFLARGWPGVLLTESPAVVFVFRFTNDVKDIILDKEPKLENWTHWRKPPLPEDICLFQSGGELPVFMSVTHEKDAWLISETRPRLKGLSADFSSAKDSFIFNGKYFCLPWKEEAMK